MAMNPGEVAAAVYVGGGGVAPSGSGAASTIQVYNAVAYGVPNIGTPAVAKWAALVASIQGSPPSIRPFTVYFPDGVYGMETDLIFPSYVTVWMARGARFKALAPGLTLTIVGELLGSREQIFDQSGFAFAISFRNAAALLFSTGINIVFPEWFGAACGDGGAAPLDAGPGIQLMTRAGTRKCLFGEGPFTLRSLVTLNESPVNPNDTTLEGTARTGSYLVAGPVAGSFGAINAMFINKQNNGKLSFKSIRFAGSGFGTPAFLGYGLYALENGVNSQAIFSGRIEDCWIGLGSSAAGFFFGGLNNYFVTNNVFEGTKVLFQLIGQGNADVHFTNNSVYSCYDAFLDMAGDALEKNLISVVGLHSYSAGGGKLFKANNCRSLKLAEITYQINDPVDAGALGFSDLLNCKDLDISSSSATRFAGSINDMATVMKFDGCTGTIEGMTIDGGDTQLAIQGNVDLTFVNCVFKNAASFILRFTGVTSGKIRFIGCKLQYAGLSLWQVQVGGCTFDLTFENCDNLDSNYGAGAAGDGSYFETSGAIRFIGGRLGRTTTIALQPAWAALTPYVEGDLRSDGGVNYRCWAAHVSTAAGAGGNEPGVGATWQRVWKKHSSNASNILWLAGTGTVTIEGTEYIDTTLLLLKAASTQAIRSQRWMNAIPAVSANKGDASVNVTTFVDPGTILFSTVLTANRVVTLVGVPGVADKKRIVRTGLGAFTLDVGGKKTIPAATAAWVDVETNDGVNWFLTGYAPL